MNELEQQIRVLHLRTPGSGMDQRILTVLHDSADVANSSRYSADSQMANPRSRCRMLLTSFAGLATALLCGIVIGNGLPAFWSVSELANDRQATQTTDLIFQEPEPKSRELHQLPPDLPTRIGDSLGSVSAVGSQFVESSYLSAIAGALLWERQNGEVFDVTTHVRDRRFDMCRDCHRVGG